jgi:hypothetical protein
LVRCRNARLIGKQNVERRARRWFHAHLPSQTAQRSSRR